MDGENKVLTKAWELFDNGHYQDAEKLYLECYNRRNASDDETRNVILMGLLYSSAFLGKYQEARSYCNSLMASARNEEEKHIAFHQFGMVERMAGNYEKAMAYFMEEESIIRAAFSADPFRLSANFYEQGYVALQMKQYTKAEQTMRAALDCAISAKDEMCKGCAYRGMGQIMAAVGNPEKASEFFAKAIVSFTDAGDLTAVEEIEIMLA